MDHQFSVARKAGLAVRQYTDRFVAEFKPERAYLRGNVSVPVLVARQVKAGAERIRFPARIDVCLDDRFGKIGQFGGV